MKKNITYVAAAKFETIIRESGLPYAPLKAWVKVSGAKGRNVYVPLTKTVGRVDISGFTCDLPGVRDLCPESEAHGSVSQGLDFSLPEDEILSAFRDLLAHMATLPEAEPRKRGGTTKKDPALGWSFQQVEAAAADAE